MIIVIADDITGAAEIAGIAKTAGFNTKLVMIGESATEDENSVAKDDFMADVIVYATDTRQMSEEDAVRLVEQLVKSLPSNCVLFKKTDSVLRGHILAECKAIMQQTAYEKLLLMPQNPSKGRIVKGGMYYINNVPLNETQFANDPEFPAKSAVVTTFGVPDAESKEDIENILQSADEKTLLAGAADLFTAMISRYVSTTCRSYSTETFKTEEPRQEVESHQSETTANDSAKPQKLILVCGSTQSTKVAESPLCRRFDAVECNMPADVFYGKSSAEAWKDDLLNAFTNHGIVLTINYPAQGGKDFAVRLRKTMADVVKTLADKKNSLSDAENSLSENRGKISTSDRLLLIIEGGATAFEVLKTLGWNSFRVVKEHFPGVVEIANSQANIILKPGSYPWGNMLG